MSLSFSLPYPYPLVLTICYYYPQIRSQGHTYRPTHIRHLPRPIGSSRHPTSRRALPTCRRDRYGCSPDPVRSRQPSDACRSRPTVKDLVGRAEGLGRRPRPLCRFWPGRLQARLHHRKRVSPDLSLQCPIDFLLTIGISQCILWLILAVFRSHSNFGIREAHLRALLHRWLSVFSASFTFSCTVPHGLHPRPCELL